MVLILIWITKCCCKLTSFFFSITKYFPNKHFSIISESWGVGLEWEREGKKVNRISNCILSALPGLLEVNYMHLWKLTCNLTPERRHFLLNTEAHHEIFVFHRCSRDKKKKKTHDQETVLVCKEKLRSTAAILPFIHSVKSFYFACLGRTQVLSLVN